VKITPALDFLLATTEEEKKDPADELNPLQEEI
jgi:hypothetical protein